VDLVGQVDDVIPYYRRASVLVVPLKSGSGTRLKILEAMSLGNPVVSTCIGALGIDAVDGEHVHLADAPQRFAESVDSLLSNRDLYERTRRSARALVEQKYDWPVIGRTMNRAIAQLCGQERG
jgi:glycosyltransferase involved in cell wall biosynthesis